MLMKTTELPLVPFEIDILQVFMTNITADTEPRREVGIGRPLPALQEASLLEHEGLSGTAQEVTPVLCAGKMRSSTT